MAEKKSLIRLPGVMSRTGESRSTIYDKIPRGEFPAPIKIGPRAVAWIESEIDDYIEQKIELARGAA